LNEVGRYAQETVQKLLVGNKSDIEDKRVVTWAEANVCSFLPDFNGWSLSNVFYYRNLQKKIN